MPVTAKVKLSNAEPTGPEQTTLYFGPDYQDGRNAEWAAATPALSLAMTVRNEVVEANGFEVGKPYTLTFTEEGNTDAPVREAADDAAPFPATGGTLGAEDVNGDG